MKRRVLSLITALALCLNLFPAWAFAAEGETGDGLCPHHPAHTEACGYVSPVLEQECTHSHNDSCYTAETDCIHAHTAECYPAPDDGSAEAEPVLCAHVCTQDSGCVTESLSCLHEHDGACGYAAGDPGAPCAFDCPVCPIEALIGKLPDSVSAHNAEQVREQIDEIYALYDALTDDEQQQVDLSPCAALLEQLDGMGSAVLVDGADPNHRVYRLTANQKLDTPFVVKAPTTIDTNGYTLTGNKTTAVQVISTVTLSVIGSGTILSRAASGVEVQPGGILRVEDPDVSIKGTTYGLEVASGADVKLSAGLYQGLTAAIKVTDDDFAALLEPGYAYFDNAGQLIPLENMATAKIVRIGQCTDHSKEYAVNSGLPTHTWTCLACGGTDTEKCTFDFTQAAGTCGSCNNEITVAVDRESLKTLAYDETVKPQNGAVTVRVRDAATNLTPDTDYTASYKTQANVGNASFTVTVTVTGEEYNGIFTENYTFTKEDLQKPVLEWKTTGHVELDYDGSPVEKGNLPDITINITSAVDLHDQLKYSYKIQGSADAYTDGLPTNAGTYDVVVSLPEGPDYQAASSDSITLKINKISPIITPPAAARPVYNGAAQNLVTAGMLKPVAVADGLEIQFAVNETGSYSAAIPTGTSAGTNYSVWYKVVGLTGNYTELNPAKASGVEIQRKSITPVVTLSQYSYQYDNEYKQPTVTVKDTGVDPATVLPDTEYQVAYVNNRHVSTEGNPAKVVVTNKTGGNYQIAEVEVKFQITHRTQEALSIIQKPDTVTYGDHFTLETSGGSGNGLVTWEIIAVDGATVATVDQDSGQVSIVGSGKATVRATKSGKDPATGLTNYEDAIAIWTLTASKKPVTAVVTAANKLYDASKTADLTVTINRSDLVGTDPFTVNATGHFTDANVGENKTVIIDSLTIPADVSAKYDISWPTTTTASITPKAAAVKTHPKADTGLTYTGSPQALVTPGTAEGGELVYSVDGGNYSYNLPAAVNAGSYTVWYKAAATDGNHTDSIPVRMSPVTISANTDVPSVQCSPSAIQYDGTEKTPTVTVTDSEGRIIPESEYTVTLPSPRIAVGKYKITVTDKPGGNYKFSHPVEVTDAFEIVARGQNPLTITDKPVDIRYGDTFYLSATGGSGGGAIHWSIKESRGVAEIDERNGTVTVTGIGGFTVEAYREAADGYSQSNTDSVRFEAKPKPVTPVVIIKPKNYDGNINVATGAITVTVRSSDLVSGDSITINGLEAFYDSANAGTNKTVMLNHSNAAVVGDHSDRYVINWPDSVTGTIDRVDAKLASAPRGANLTYSPGTAQNLIAAGTGTTVNNIGTVEYSTRQDGAYSTAIPTGTNAGTYTVWYKVADSVNYTGIPAASIGVEIKKATPTISTNPTASGAVGESLKDIRLNGGATDVSGKFAWKDGSIKPGVGTSKQYVVFTPDDTTNYNTVEFQITVTVQAATLPDDGTDSGTNATPPASPNTTPPQTAVQDGTANAVVSAEDVDKLVQAAAENQSPTIVIKPEIAGDVTEAQVSIPASTMSQIQNETNASLTISTPIADATIPHEALGTLVGAGGEIIMTAKQTGQAVTFTLTAGGETVEQISGGLTLTVPVEDAGPGTVAVLVHEDGAREVIQQSIVKDGKMSIPLDGSATVEIVDNGRTFADVTPENWASEAVAFATARELFGGTSETSFSPDETMSRAMLATVLYRLEGQPEQAVMIAYSDVSDGAWYADSIAWAVENGIVNGCGDGQFGPNDSVTREQFIVMLWRYAGSPKASRRDLEFADAAQVSDYAQEALCWAVENGVLKGNGSGQLVPGGTATRAEAAQMLKNFMENT